MKKALKLFSRQLSLPLQPDDPVPVPAERRRELEQILADLLLSAASADVDKDGRKLH